VKGSLFSFGIEEPPGDHPAAYLHGEAICVRNKAELIELVSCSMIGLRGEHNLKNVLDSCAICVAVGFPPAAIRAGVAGFGGVSHRLELVRTWKGVSWYNDSIATAPERVIAAIRSFEEPIVLLVGGRDKNLPWDELVELIYQRVDHLVIFGEGREKIRQALSSARKNQEQSSQRPYTTSECAGLYEAVQEAALVAEAGDVVLLSPGGTSFDEFRDFEDRGEAFRKWVRRLR
jgi:UDP-N-acetylmuramoylalanine--D-glutamate ligase